MELSGKTAKSVTTVQDCASSFVGVKPLDICEEISGHLPSYLCRPKEVC